jgi:hypothetical protein
LTSGKIMRKATEIYLLLFASVHLLIVGTSGYSNIFMSKKISFCAITSLYFVCAFIAFLLFRYTKIHSVLCGLIIIIITGFLYLIFLAICAKIDKRKKKKLEESGKKDPFTRN